MSRPDNERNVQLFLILANLPQSVLRQPPGENWKPVKDLIYSHIHCEDREYGRIDIADGVAVCRMHDVEQRREAYDALQGFSWRGMILKAWLCEKRGHIMEQSAGPIDRQTGDIIPAPGHLMRMTPSLARRIGCIPLARPLSSPPLSPQYGVKFVPLLTANAVFGLPYRCPPRAHLMSAYDLQMVGGFPKMTPPLSQKSSTSSISTISTAFPLDSAHPQFRDDPSPPGTPLTSQAPGLSGRASASGSSSVSTTPGRPSSAISNRSTVASHALGVTGYNKIKIQNFNPEVTIPDLQHYLERTIQLYVVRKKTCKGNGRCPRVFMTFYTNEDAEIAVQHLNGSVVSGRKLCVSLDLQRRWHTLAGPGKSLKRSMQIPLPVKRSGPGKPPSTATARKETTARKGPVIIDGSQE